MRNSSLSLKRRQYQRSIISLLNIEDAITRVQELIDDIFRDTRSVVLYWNDGAGAFIPVKPEDRDDKLKFRIFDDFMLWLGEQDRIFSKHDFQHSKKFGPVREAALEFFTTTRAEIIVPFNLNKSVLALLYLVGREGGWVGAKAMLFAGEDGHGLQWDVVNGVGQFAFGRDKDGAISGVGAGVIGQMIQHGLRLLHEFGFLRGDLQHCTTLQIRPQHKAHKG